MREQKIAIIQLGSNIGNRRKNIALAVNKLTKKVGEVHSISSIYETIPWGNSNQPNFLNQIIVINTVLDAYDILKFCQSIEKALGPGKIDKWGARIIDLDLLFYNSDIIQNDNLVLPHPRIQERRFVLEPLNEILPDFVHPVLDVPISELLRTTSDQLKVEKIPTETMIQDNLQYRYIAIEGNIGAGKTTFAEMLSSKLDGRLILEQFSDNPFLPYFYKEPERFAFPVELFFMTERHKQLQENLMQQNMFLDFVVSDYFFLKTLLFAGNNLDKEELRLFQRLFNILNSSFPQPEILIYFHRPVDVLLSQIKKRGRPYESDISADYLLGIQNTYLDYFKSVKDFPVLVVDIGDTDFKDNPFVFEELVGLLMKDYKNGVNPIVIST